MTADYADVADTEEVVAGGGFIFLEEDTSLPFLLNIRAIRVIRGPHFPFWKR